MTSEAPSSPAPLSPTLARPGEGATPAAQRTGPQISVRELGPITGTSPLASSQPAPATSALPTASQGGAAHLRQITSPVAPGELVAGKYQVERVLGQGGMGIVVAATHLILGTSVAIKFLAPRSFDGEAVARFMREAQIVSKLTSEHVVEVVDMGQLDDGTPYMVMELLDGHDLASELRERGPLPVEEAVEHVLQACEAIAEAHVQGMVHRDIKPSNLFLSHRADGTPLVKVLDFGIAKVNASNADSSDGAAQLTHTTDVLGSPTYMSPEQIRSAKRVDLRTDIWSMGIVLHTLLTGSLPFTADSVSGLMIAIVTDPPVKLREQMPDLPEELEAVVLKCIEKDPSQRFQDMAQLAEALIVFAPERAQVSLSRISGVIARGGAPVTRHSPGARALKGETSLDETVAAPSTDGPKVVTRTRGTAARKGSSPAATAASDDADEGSKQAPKRPRNLVPALLLAAALPISVGVFTVLSRGEQPPRAALAQTSAQPSSPTPSPTQTAPSEPSARPAAQAPSASTAADASAAPAASSSPPSASAPKLAPAGKPGGPVKKPQSSALDRAIENRR